MKKKASRKKPARKYYKDTSKFGKRTTSTKIRAAKPRGTRDKMPQGLNQPSVRMLRYT